MEISGENDPLDQIINGDQATENDVQTLESLAYGLLSREVGCVKASYKIGDLDGPYVEVSTYDDESDLSASICLVGKDYDTLFYVELDEEDSVIELHLEENSASGNSVSFDLGMVVLNTYDTHERVLFDQIHSFAKDLEDGKIKKPLGKVIAYGKPVEDSDRLVYRLRSLVDRKATEVVLIKEFGVVTGDNTSMTVTSREVMEGHVPETGPNKLDIEFEDRNLGIGYYFEHDQDDDCSVTATHLSDALDDKAEQLEEPECIAYEDEELAVSAIMRMYKGNLAKLHIDLLIEQLMEAELQNGLPLVD